MPTKKSINEPLAEAKRTIAQMQALMARMGRYEADPDPMVKALAHERLREYSMQLAGLSAIVVEAASDYTGIPA